MDPLHATIEEFAAEGFTHFECHLPALPRDEVEADELAPSHLDGADPRATIRAAPLCRLRWSIALGQAVANGRRVREAARAERVAPLALMDGASCLEVSNGDDDQTYPH